MKLLLHACCADCILKFVDSIKKEGTEIGEVVAYFYNPNIHPRAEYLSRLKAMQKVAEENKIKLVVADWSPKEYFEGIKPIPNPSLDRAGRCLSCWKLRLKKTFGYASDKKFELISSTLMTSHYQNGEKIKEIAKKFEKKYKIKFLVPKNISKDLKTSGFYKQNYCGCCFSLTETWVYKFC